MLANIIKSPICVAFNIVHTKYKIYSGVMFTFYVLLLYFCSFFVCGLRSCTKFYTCLRPFITFILTVTVVPWWDFKPTFIFPISWVSSFRECEMGIAFMALSRVRLQTDLFYYSIWPPFHSEMLQIHITQYPTTSFGSTISISLLPAIIFL